MYLFALSRNAKDVFFLFPFVCSRHVCFAIHWPSLHTNVSASPASLAWMHSLYNCTGVWLYLRRAHTQKQIVLSGELWTSWVHAGGRPVIYASLQQWRGKKKQIVFVRSAESSKRRCRKDNLSGALWVASRWRIASSGSISCFLGGCTQVQTLISCIQSSAGKSPTCETKCGIQGFKVSHVCTGNWPNLRGVLHLFKSVLFCITVTPFQQLQHNRLAKCRRLLQRSSLNEPRSAFYSSRIQ